MGVFSFGEARNTLPRSFQLLPRFPLSYGGMQLRGSAAGKDFLYFATNSNVIYKIDQNFRVVALLIPAGVARTITIVQVSDTVERVLVGTVANHFYYSDDGGSSWTNASAGMPSNNVLSAKNGLSSLEVFAYLLNNQVIRSMDGGQSWAVVHTTDNVASEGGSSQRLCVGDDGVMVVATGQARMAMSANGVAGWSNNNLTAFTTQTFAGVENYRAAGKYLTGAEKIIYSAASAGVWAVNSVPELVLLPGRYWAGFGVAVSARAALAVPRPGKEDELWVALASGGELIVCVFRPEDDTFWPVAAYPVADANTAYGMAFFAGRIIINVGELVLISDQS